MRARVYKSGLGPTGDCKVQKAPAIPNTKHTSLHIHTYTHTTTGVVIRAMDRGTDAADTVVTYLFLYLLP